MMPAESYIEQGTNLPEAMALIKEGRSSPSNQAVPYSTALNQADARTALRCERQIEFAGE
ncbi:MAG: hypothetical protein ABI687_13885 [Flavitalea sp.]